MSWPPLEVADIIRAAGDAFIERNRHWLGWKHVKVLLAIARCRTAALGGHRGVPGYERLREGFLHWYARPALLYLPATPISSPASSTTIFATLSCLQAALAVAV